MNNNELTKTFSVLADIDQETAKRYTDVFLECIRRALLNDGKLQLDNMFVITLKDIPGGTKPVFNPRTGTYNVRKPHKQLNITPDGDKLLIGGEYDG